MWFLLAELRNLLAFFRKAKAPSKKGLEDYTIVVPVWGEYKILKFLEKYAHKTLFLTLASSTSKLKSQLSHFKDLGAKTFEVGSQALARDDVKFSALKSCLEKGWIQTKYMIMIDADSYFKGNIGSVCQVLEEEKFDLATLKIVPDTGSNLLEKLQRVEYRIGMRARHYMPWFTSACFIARTDAMRKIMQHHTSYPFGGDVEVGLIAKVLGMKVAHIGFNIYTRVPKSIKMLFKQRKRWWAGAFRRVVINAKTSAVHEPLDFFYTFIFVYLLYPLRWLIPLFMPKLFFTLFPIVWLIHIPITLLCCGSKPPWVMILFPLYAFFRVTLLLLPLLGIIDWFKNYRKTKDTGRFRV